MPAVHEQELKKKLEEVWQSGGAGREALREEIDRRIPLPLPIISTRVARRFRPVLTRGSPGSWDDSRVDNPWVIWDPWWRKFRMWYTGRKAPEDHYGRVGYASSSDGITWTKYAKNPIFLDPDNKGYPNWDTEGLRLVIKMEERKRKYYGVYEQVLRDENLVFQETATKLAVSDDGINWTPTGYLLDFVKSPNFIEPTCIWVDGEGNFHILVSRRTLGLTQAVIEHYVSGDFESWELVETLDLSFDRSLYGKRWEDMFVLPMGGSAALVLYNVVYQYRYLHTLEMATAFGGRLKNLVYLGPAITPNLEISKNLFDYYCYHEPCVVVAPTRYGEEYRVYWFRGYSPDEDTVTGDIHMGWLLVGEDKTVIPVLSVSSVGAGATSDIWDSVELPLHGVNSLNLTAKATFDAAATAGAKVHVYASSDGIDYSEYTSFDIPLQAGQTVIVHQPLTPAPAFIKVTVENLDGAHSITDVVVEATVGK